MTVDGTASADLSGDGRAKGKNLVLAAMIFAVSMTFIDMTIVSIAIPEVQKELGLSSTGVQWVVNAYLLSLAALFAFGGRIGDMLGHKKMVLIGVVVFAAASTMCGLTPTGGAAEPWIIVFRAVQGLGAALMFPAALAIVVASFPFRERGKAMAVFFGVAGGLTAVGPLLGGYLSEWTWRSIFWVNIPVAVIAVVLTLMSKPVDTSKRSRLDVPGVVLIAVGMGLSVLGFQQAGVWGWTSPWTIGCIIVGLAVMVGFVRYERIPESPLIDLQIFRVRAFFVQNAVLFVTMMAFIPVFFFASMYAQISLGSSSSEAGLYMLTFFAGFGPAAQVGGRMLDTMGAKRPVVLGCLLAAAGFFLWAGELTDISGGLGSQWYYIVLTGAGMGLMLGPANTDAINRAPSDAYGEATGITQTVRNYGSSVGMAVLGTLLISRNRVNIEGSLTSLGLSKGEADEVAQSLSQAGGGDSSQLSSHASASQVAEVFKAVQTDFAQSVETVFYGMAIVMVVGAVIALVGLRAGTQEGIVETQPDEDLSPTPTSTG